jgi:hypothetical protein
VVGKVEVQRARGAWAPVDLRTIGPLVSGDAIRTDGRGDALLEFPA